MARRRVLLCDPPAGLAGQRTLSPPAAADRFDLRTEPTVTAGLAAHDRDRFDAAVVGSTVAETDAVDAIETIREHDASVPVLVFAADASADRIEALLTAGATDYVSRDGAGALVRLAHRLRVAIDAAVATDSSSTSAATVRTDAAATTDATAATAETTWSAAATTALVRLHEATSREQHSFEEKLGLILEIGTEELGYPIGYLTRVDGRRVEVLATAGDHDRLEAGMQSPLSDTYCQFTLEDEAAATLAVGDAERDDRYRSLGAYTDFGLRCYLGATLRVNDEAYGSLCFADTDPRDPATVEAQRPTVEALAQWVAYEFERHRYEMELQRQIDRLEEFTSVVSHDLRNPLNIAQGRTELATAACDNEHLAVVDNALDRMEAIIEDSLTLARQGRTVETKASIEIAELLDRCWRVVDTGEAELRVVDDFRVHGDPDRLARIFENLFRNSVEHGSTSSQTGSGDSVEHGSTSSQTESGDSVEHGERDVTIRVGLLAVMYTSTRAETDGTFGFYVEDDGPGVPSDRREDVFDPGETTHPDGTGFGLAIVKRIAEAHGWSVSLTESIDGGARFEFTNVT